MKRCRHTNIRGGHLTQPVDSYCHYKEVAVRVCRDCGEWLGMGPANDTAEALIELRAAEIAANRDSSAPINWCNIVEWFGFDGVDDRAVRASSPSDWQAGYLARCIATHDTEHAPASARRSE